jgi:hypothetical protein
MASDIETMKRPCGSLQLVERIEPRWLLGRVGGSFPAQSF